MVNISLFRLLGNAVQVCPSLTVPRVATVSTWVCPLVEETGTVGSRKESRVHTRSDGCSSLLSSVRTDIFVENEVSHLFFSYFVENIVDIFARFRIFLQELFLRLRFHSVHFFLTFRLVVNLNGFCIILGCLVIADRGSRSVRNLMDRKFSLRFAHFRRNLFDESDTIFSISSWANIMPSRMIIFRNFIGSRLYHHDRIFRTGYLQIDIADRSLRLCRIR